LYYAVLTHHSLTFTLKPALMTVTTKPSPVGEEVPKQILPPQPPAGNADLSPIGLNSENTLPTEPTIHQPGDPSQAESVVALIAVAQLFQFSNFSFLVISFTAKISPRVNFGEIW
jgi:hypothetical protein